MKKKEQDFFCVPNIYIDKYMRLMSPYAFCCLTVILRNRHSVPGRYVEIPLFTFMKQTMIKDRRTIVKALKELKKLDLIEQNSRVGFCSQFRAKY